jgi:DHA1 family chloramphenicol resistance protein-like MFS transporter
LWHTLVLAALVNGATFATFAYFAVVATEVAGLPAGAVPGLLAAFGAGAFVGVTMAERFPLRGALLALPVGWALLAGTSTVPVVLFVMTVVQGALSFGVGSALVARVLADAAEAPSLGGSFATVALNVGAVLGPVLAGVVSAVWLSVGLSTVALVLLPFFRREADDSRVVQSGR